RDISKPGMSELIIIALGVALGIILVPILIAALPYLFLLLVVVGALCGIVLAIVLIIVIFHLDSTEATTLTVLVFFGVGLLYLINRSQLSPTEKIRKWRIDHGLDPDAPPSSKTAALT